MKTLIGRSGLIKAVREAITQIAAGDTNVIITGEPGSGKTVAGRMIHEASRHADQPFAALDIPGIDEIRLRSIVHSVVSKREFVNPQTSDHGNFSLPDGATLILDGLSRASHPAQTIIAEFLGKVRSSLAALRFIGLIDGTVGEEIRQGRLLGELADAIRDWKTIHLPPLRERAEDIPDLVEHFVLETAREMDLGNVVIDVNALSVLVRKEWKGNVKELKTFVERAMLLSEDKERFVLPEGLIDEQSEVIQMLERIDRGIDFAIDASMELIEKKILERVLKKFGFNQSRAARFLKITEDTLRYRMKKLAIQNPQQTEKS